MGTFNPEHFKDVIGEKIIFEGHPATIIDFVSCYEGDFWRIKIEGVLHEFSSIPNVVEDVPEVIVNLKNVRLNFAENEEKVMRINFKGEGEVTAGDIITDGTVEILNPDLHIATVAEGGQLIMELTADMGRGYSPSEKNKKPNQDISVLPIDSIYTPVKKVNYQVENTRVGQTVDYDKLVIEVWTDGSLKAHEALSLAAKVMTGHLELFIDLSEKTKNTQVMIEKEEAKKEEERKAKLPQLTDEGRNNLKNIYHSETKRVFLTFDDGPSRTVTPVVLDTLKSENIKATFFLLGSRVELDPDLVKREYDELQPEYDIIQAMIDARASQNITQKELSDRTGITQADISRIEHGTRNPSLAMMKKLAAGLGMQLKLEFLPFPIKK